MTDDTEEPIDIDRMEQLAREIREHPVALARFKWVQLGRSFDVMRLNHDELLSLVDEYETSHELAIEVMRSSGNQKVRDAFITELYRRLMNYVTSAKSLVDHTRKLAKKYEGTEFGDAYADRVATLAEDPVTRFVQKLRDYTLHFALPMVSTEINFGSDDGFSGRLLLLRDDLLEFDEWPAPAKVYLTAQEEQFAVRKPVEEYLVQVEELYTWFAAQFNVIYADELRELIPLATEHDAIVARLMKT